VQARFDFLVWLKKCPDLHTSTSRRSKKAIQSIDCRSSMCRVEMLDDRSQKFFFQLNDTVMNTASNFRACPGST